jgi:NitT/TauT family transport system substrate-binding protein
MRYVGQLLWALLLVAALGCQSAAPPAAAPAAPPAAPAAASAAAPAATSAAAPPAAAAAATTAMPAPLSPPVTVRVGLLQSVSDSGVYIGYERGYYRELGLDLQLETIPDPNTIMTMVSTNQLEVGGAGVNANPFSAAARGIGVKIVAGKGQFLPGFGFSGIVARQDLLDSGELRSFGDLKGHTIARLAPCDSTDPAVERGFERAGITRDQVQWTYMSFPDMNAAFANGAIDAGWQIEPLATLAAERGLASKFAMGDVLYPNQQIAALFYAPDFTARTDAAQRFMVAYVRSLRDYNDAFVKGIGRADVVQVLAKHTTVKDLALYDKFTPAGLDPDGRLNVPGIRDDVALYARLGCVTGELSDVRQVIDESFITYAGSVLGPYAR